MQTTIIITALLAAACLAPRAGAQVLQKMEFPQVNTRQKKEFRQVDPLRQPLQGNQSNSLSPHILQPITRAGNKPNDPFGTRSSGSAYGGSQSRSRAQDRTNVYGGSRTGGRSGRGGSYRDPFRR